MRPNATVLSRRLHRFLSEEDIADVARDAGFGSRVRKCPPVIFFWTLVLGLNAEAKRSLSGLRRFFVSITGRSISSAAFQKRFTPEAATMFKRIFERLLEKGMVAARVPLPRRLRRFRDVLAVDSTAFPLHDKLAKHFRGYRSKGTKAMARVSATMGLADHSLRTADVSSGRRSETRFFRVTKKLAGHLVVMDLGYFSIQRFRDLARVGAHFISRLKNGTNPRILAVHQGASRPKRIVGKRLKEVHFQGRFVDFDARLGEGTNSIIVRIVGVFNDEEGQYHFYLTQLDRESFGPTDISEAYRLRWQIELLFRELKQVGRLSHVPTGKKPTALCLIFASLIVHLITRHLGWLLMNKRPWQFSPVTWTSFVLTYAWGIARALVTGDEETLSSLLKEVRKSAPKECVRASRGRAEVYGACFA